MRFFTSSGQEKRIQAGGPGTELAYNEFTSNVSITATTEATANTVVAASAVAFDGATRVRVEFYAVLLHPPVGQSIVIVLYDGSSSIGVLGQASNATAVAVDQGAMEARFLTPSNASHTYSVRAYVTSGTGTVYSGAAGAGVYVPGYIRITRA